MIEGTNSSNVKFFEEVTCPKIFLAEFNYTLNQSGHALCHRRLYPLILDNRELQKLVHPWHWNMHID
jgi:hypothetical protein